MNAVVGNVIWISGRAPLKIKDVTNTAQTCQVLPLDEVSQEEDPPSRKAILEPCFSCRKRLSAMSTTCIDSSSGCKESPAQSVYSADQVPLHQSLQQRTNRKIVCMKVAEYSSQLWMCDVILRQKRPGNWQIMSSKTTTGAAKRATYARRLGAAA